MQIGSLIFADDQLNYEQKKQIEDYWKGEYSFDACMKDYAIYGDIYEFGVYGGLSLSILVRRFQELDIPFRKVFGIDSFEGLPDEPRKDLPNHTTWYKGNFNVQNLYGMNKDQCIKKLEEAIPHAIFIPKWFNALTNEDICIYDMGPASYVNMDCDLYSSAKDALTFMITNGLLQTGTIIRYDDWNFNENEAGVSEAHYEMMSLHGIKHEQLRKQVFLVTN